jgi:hypothetical protein
MGQINEYQRKQLASSMTGTPAADRSGQILGQSMTAFGNALTERQEALDIAEVSKAFYRYVAADTIQTAELQKEYLSNSDIDPLTFTQKYEERTTVLSQQFKEKLPSRVQGKFEILVEKQKAEKSVGNTKWVMDLQNRNALEGFQSLGDEFNLIAGQTTNVPDFMASLSAYDDGSLGFKALTTKSSYEATKKTHLQNMALSHLNGRMDIDNGGNPVALWADLEQNPEYRQKLSSILGEKALQKTEKNLDAAMTNMGIDRGFQKLLADDSGLIETSEKIFARDNKFGLNEMETMYQKEANSLTYMKNNNVKGVNDEAIKQAEKNLGVYADLVEIARYTNDVSYPTKPEVKAELIADINQVLLPFKETKIKKELAKAPTNIERQLAEQAGNVPLSFGGIVTGSYIGKTVVRSALESLTGVPKDIRAEKEEKVKAGKSVSEYMKELYEVKGKILAARKNKEITSSDARELIAKFAAPLSTLNSYDTVQTKGKNWFTTGFNSFNDYVRNVNLQGSAAENRTIRDTLKSQMMSRLSTEVSLLGMEPTDELISAAISNIKTSMSKQWYSEFAQAKPGDTVMYRNRPVEFAGFDSNTGQPLTKVSTGLQKAVDNT